MSSRVHPVAAPMLRDDSQRRAQVIDMASYRRRLDVRDHDSIVNALWNELTRLAQEAWTWRDPEIVEALEYHLTILKAHVHADWQK
jgi:hypothetical protein